LPVDSLDELLDWKPTRQRQIISDGILLPETSLMIFGGAKSWKSMLSLHLMYCLSSGKDWFGFHTSKCSTLRYQVELPKAVERDRVEKFMSSNGSRPLNMYFETSPYSKIDTGYGKQALEKSIKDAQERSPENHLVLILDPVYLLITGHISDDYDVKKLLDNINWLKAKYHFSVVLLHHTHKTRVNNAGEVIDLGSEEVMGSSLFNDWIDTMVRVSLTNPNTGKNKVRLTFELSRHAQKMLPTFNIEWDRATLHPKTLKREIITEEDVSIRNLTGSATSL
jgi:RecA-family ATPase